MNYRIANEMAFTEFHNPLFAQLQKNNEDYPSCFKIIVCFPPKRYISQQTDKAIKPNNHVNRYVMDSYIHHLLFPGPFAPTSSLQSLHYLQSPIFAVVSMWLP